MFLLRGFLFLEICIHHTFYRHKVVRSTERSQPTRKASANWRCYLQLSEYDDSQENLNYTSHRANVESLDNIITIVCKGRNVTAGGLLFLSSQTIQNLGFVGVREESLPSCPHTVMSLSFGELFYKTVALFLQALSRVGLL